MKDRKSEFVRACWKLLPAALLLLVGASIGAQLDITGFWVFRVPNGDGTFRESYFDLKQSGEAVTGNAVQQNRQVPISDGVFKDGTLHFTVSTTFGNPPQTRTVVYEGHWDGEKFTFTSNVQSAARGPITTSGTLEHSTPEAAQPPAKLPLPELHDVPDNGLARTPPMGWNSWNKFARRVDDATVRSIADAMVSSGMKDAGYVYVNIDDTWEGARDAQGNITGNLKFPNMKALADYVHSKGLKIGIYSSPGPKTCAGYEGSYGHEQQDANTYAAWGIDYLKYDWCSADTIYGRGTPELMAGYQKMGDALLKTGRPIVFSLCEYGWGDVWTWGSKAGGNLWRTTNDISDRWQSMSNIGFRQFDIAQYIKVGHWNDPDMLEIGNGGMTADEYRTHMSLWSMLAAPLIAGNDVRSMTDETVSILENKEVIAIDQDPAGHPVKQISAPDATAVVLARPLADGSMAVGLFNRGDAAQEVDVQWSAIGLGGKKLTVRDLWKHEGVDVSGDKFSASVPPHGVVMLKVKGLYSLVPNAGEPPKMVGAAR
jgi:alpha-galactosidase